MGEMVLRGIPGANPLGFLTALGALRLSDLLWPRVRLRWIQDGGWRPVLCGVPSAEPEFCSRLATEACWAPLAKFEGLGNNLTVSRESFESVVRAITVSSEPADRLVLDFVAAFGCEAMEDKDKGRIEYTDLSFITGSGHQHFLGTARTLQSYATAQHLAEALFGPWKFADRGNSFRWDPEDAKEYALRWDDPSKEGVSTVWGANRLAFEALPWFPTIPTITGLRTTGFRTVKGGAHEFTWPIWTHAVGADAVRSLVAIHSLQDDVPDREKFHAMGIEEVFRAQRVRIGQGANFKVSFRPARAV